MDKTVRTYRLSDKTIEQLQELSKHYCRTMSEQIEWMVQEAHKEMLEAKEIYADMLKNSKRNIPE